VHVRHRDIYQKAVEDHSPVMQKKVVTLQRNNEYAEVQDYSIIKVTHIEKSGRLVILRLDWIGV